MKSGRTSSASLLVTVALAALFSISVAAPTKAASPLKRLLTGIVSRLPEELDRELFEPPFLRFTEEGSPADTKAVEGSPVTLLCEATGIPPPTLHWSFDGQPLNQGKYERDDNTLEKLMNLGLVTIENGVTQSKLRLDCVTPEMAGQYACIAENGYSTKQSLAKLQVIANNAATGCARSKKSGSKESEGTAPVIYMWTDGRFERAGATAQLYCRARGNPEPKITWTTESGDVITDGGSFSLLPNGDLVIKNAGYDQEGGYTCIASNKLGEDRAETFFYPTEPENGSKSEAGEQQNGAILKK